MLLSDQQTRCSPFRELRLSLALGPTVSARNALQAKWRRFWGAMPGNPKPEPAMPEPYNRERV